MKISVEDFQPQEYKIDFVLNVNKFKGNFIPFKMQSWHDLKNLQIV